MKRITNPGIGKIAIALIPPVLILFIPSLFERFPILTLSVYIICVAVFALFTGYYCIRQKCYAQLAVAVIIVMLLVAALIFMHNPHAHTLP